MFVSFSAAYCYRCCVVCVFVKIVSSEKPDGGAVCDVDLWGFKNHEWDGGSGFPISPMEKGTLGRNLWVAKANE